MGLQTQQQVRRERAAGGALNFTDEKLNPKVVSISCMLGDRFQLRFQPTDPFVSPQSTSLEEIAQIVLLGVSAGSNPERQTVKPADVDRCRQVLSALCGSLADAASLDQPLNSLIPMSQRRTARRQLQERLDVRLPRLGISPIALKVAIALAVVATYAIVVPLAEWSDQAHPVHDPPFLVRTGAAILVRGGFFILLILLVIIFREIGGLLFPGFPAGCATLSELALFTGALNPATESSPGWTLEQVRDEVRDVVSKVAKIPRTAINMQWKLAELNKTKIARE